MLSEFSINIDYSKNIPCINIQGEIDIYTCSDLRETLEQLEIQNVELDIWHMSLLKVIL